MAEWQAVHVATITEEDVEQEEVGEDGTVATILTNSAPEAGPSENGVVSKTSGDENRGSVIERQDSLVENEVEGGVAGATSSLLQDISFDVDPFPHPDATRTLPAKASSSRASPTRTSPSRFPNSLAAPSSPQSSRKKFSQRRGSRTAGFTMTLSDKFVTELSLYDPGSSCGGKGGEQVCLGLFLATDQVTGDHTVYKVSPVSPLAALKLKPQDRVLKVNGLSLAGWSHSCVVEWVRGLSLVPTKQLNDEPRELMLGLEYRRAGKCVRAPWEAPGSRQVLTVLAMTKKRAIVKSLRETESGLHHRYTQTCRVKLSPLLSGSPQQAVHNSHLPSRYLASYVLPGGGVGLGVVEGKEAERDEAQFLIHTFDVSSPLHRGAEGRGREDEVIVMEAVSPPSWFLIPTSLTHLAFMHCPWSAVMGLTQVDPRCFTLHHVGGEEGRVRVEAVYTGNLVCPGDEGVVMVSKDTKDPHLHNSTVLQLVPV